MKKKKALVWGFVLFGAIFIAGIAFTGCHRPGMFCGGGCGSEDFPKNVLEKIDSRVEKLNLNETQQAQYEGIRDRVKAQLMEVCNTKKAFFEKVKAEMDRTNPDLAMVSDMLKSHAENIPIRAGMFIDDFMAFYEILNMDQRAIVVENLKKKFQKFEAFRSLVNS